MEAYRPRSRFVGVVAVSAWMAIIGTQFVEPSHADQPPREAQPVNVLFVICDDLNDTVEGMGGHPQARTPNIDRLMRSGVRFCNAHSAAPVCGPSRASLWTGLYAHTTGVYGHDQNNYTWRDSPVLKDAVTLFEHLAAGGYDTYATGKIFHNNHHTAGLFREATEKGDMLLFQKSSMSPFLMSFL